MRPSAFPSAYVRPSPNAKPRAIRTPTNRANPAASMTALLVVLSPRHDAALPQRLLAQLVQRCGILGSAFDSQRVPHRKVSTKGLLQYCDGRKSLCCKGPAYFWHVVTFGPSALPNRFVTWGNG
jgi:hypothetical protein